MARPGLGPPDSVSGGTERAIEPPERLARPVRLVLTIAAVALSGATAFGLWHLVVGGLLNGNPRAAMFGLILALVAGSALVLGAVFVRRRLRGV
jgi:hypothetical protein